MAQQGPGGVTITPGPRFYERLSVASGRLRHATRHELAARRSLDQKHELLPATSLPLWIVPPVFAHVRLPLIALPVTVAPPELFCTVTLPATTLVVMLGPPE